MGDFGEVRSWVGDANPFAWGRLCAALSTWPHDARFFGEVLPYVQSHIAKSSGDEVRSNALVYPVTICATCSEYVITPYALGSTLR